MKVPSTFTSKESIQRNIRIWAITYVKRRWLMQIHAIFKKILFTHLKSIYFCFEAPTKVSIFSNTTWEKINVAKSLASNVSVRL